MNEEHLISAGLVAFLALVFVLVLRVVGPA